MNAKSKLYHGLVYKKRKWKKKQRASTIISVKKNLNLKEITLILSDEIIIASYHKIHVFSILKGKKVF